jgi:hypothetical protein
MLPMVVLAGLLVGGAAYGSYAWSRRRRAPLPRTPAEIALARLADAQALIEARAGREFSIEVSSIVRDYIETQFEVRAAHRTTDEFLHELAAQADSPLAAHRETFIPFLEHCDLAKFARWNLPECRLESMLDSARALILSIAQPAQTPAPTSEPVRHSDLVIRHSPAPQS